MSPRKSRRKSACFSSTITSSPGQSVVIINNDSTDAITGTFSGKPEGSTVTISGINFLISYVGGSNNNDVVLVQAETSVFVTGGNLVVTVTDPVMYTEPWRSDAKRFRANRPKSGRWDEQIYCIPAEEMTYQDLVGTGNVID